MVCWGIGAYEGIVWAGGGLGDEWEAMFVPFDYVVIIAFPLRCGEGAVLLVDGRTGLFGRVFHGGGLRFEHLEASKQRDYHVVERGIRVERKHRSTPPPSSSL